MEGCIVGQGLLQLGEESLQVNVDDLPDHQVGVSFNVGELYHEESFSHFADVETVDFGCRVVGELGIVDKDISQLAHAEVLSAEVLKLDQRLLGFIISTNLVHENASFL